MPVLDSVLVNEAGFQASGPSLRQPFGFKLFFSFLSILFGVGAGLGVGETGCLAKNPVFCLV